VSVKESIVQATSQGTNFCYSAKTKESPVETSQKEDKENFPLLGNTKQLDMPQTELSSREVSEDPDQWIKAPFFGSNFLLSAVFTGNCCVSSSDSSGSEAGQKGTAGSDFHDRGDDSQKPGQIEVGDIPHPVSLGASSSSGDSSNSSEGKSSNGSSSKDSSVPNAKGPAFLAGARRGDAPSLDDFRRMVPGKKIGGGAYGEVYELKLGDANTGNGQAALKPDEWVQKKPKSGCENGAMAMKREQFMSLEVETGIRKSIAEAEAYYDEGNKFLAEEPEAYWVDGSSLVVKFGRCDGENLYIEKISGKSFTECAYPNLGLPEDYYAAEAKLGKLEDEKRSKEFPHRSTRTIAEVEVELNEAKSTILRFRTQRGENLSLDRLLKRRHVILTILPQIAAALSILHKSGIVHHDLSANNVMITELAHPGEEPSYGIKLIDLGCAIKCGTWRLDKANDPFVTLISEHLAPPELLLTRRSAVEKHIRCLPFSHDAWGTVCKEAAAVMHPASDVYTFGTQLLSLFFARSDLFPGNGKGLVGESQAEANAVWQTKGRNFSNIQMQKAQIAWQNAMKDIRQTLPQEDSLWRTLNSLVSLSDFWIVRNLQKREIFLRDLDRLLRELNYPLDPALRYPPDQLDFMAGLIRACMDRNPIKRPTAAQVSAMLQIFNSACFSGEEVPAFDEIRKMAEDFRPTPDHYFSPETLLVYAYYGVCPPIKNLTNESDVNAWKANKFRLKDFID
jgi:serine/threonine protein kinase